MDKGHALCLAGGGTRGAYQVGACKALKKIGIEYDAISGTSIGAINGAIITQGDLDLLEELYENIKPEDILVTNLDMDFEKDIFHISNFFKMSGEYILHGGYKNTALLKLLEDNIDIDRVYSSKIDYGMVTFEIDTLQAVEKFKENIPKEQLLDYILASANMPIFRAQKIKDKKFIDGGIVNNLPVNMLSSKGYKNIIAIDLHGIGIVPPVKEEDVYIKTIRPTVSLGGFLDFNKEKMRKNMTMGYMDALKAFGKLQGNFYFFKPKEYIKLLDYFNTSTINSLEAAGEVLGLDQYKERTCDGFLNDLFEEYQVEIKAKENKKINLFNLIEFSDKKRILINIVEQTRTSPLHSPKIENVIYKDLTESAKAILELEQYMNNK